MTALAALAVVSLAAPTVLATHTTIGLPEEGCAITQGGWGAEPSGHNPGALLHHWFDDLFPTGLTVGDMFFADAQAVTDFLPSANTLRGNAVALALNIEFGDAGLLNGTISSVLSSSSDPALDNKTAVEILEIAENVLLTEVDPDQSTHSELQEVMDDFNNERFGCDEVPSRVPCPENVQAQAQQDGPILLTWDAVTDADEYRIHRAAEGETLFVFLDNTTETQFLDETTTIGVTYRYIVTAVIGGVEAENCEEVEATAIPFFAAPVLGALAVGGGVGAYRLMRRRT